MMGTILRPPMARMLAETLKWVTGESSERPYPSETKLLLSCSNFSCTLGGRAAEPEMPITRVALMSSSSSFMNCVGTPNCRTGLYSSIMRSMPLVSLGSVTMSRLVYIPPIMVCMMQCP